MRLRTLISIQNNTIAYCTHTAKFLLIQFHNFTSDNSEILKIQHVRKIVPRPKVLFLTRKNVSMKQATLT
jgi:hypothetical protein